ncbi:hypothetical protein [Mucilaginibacter sp.]|uniref:hypothetical protein n=1 Tax=Mucilaginibacter sp. TaxID=1882438 RepID=UPI003D14CAFE
MMTDKVFAYTFRLMNQQSALILTKYENDETVLNNLYEEMLLDVEANEGLGFVNYLTKLISFLEAKEDYEKCSMLLKLKNKIKEIL